MLDKKRNVYQLKKMFGSVLANRSIAIELRDTVLKDRVTAVEFDFVGVTFITRAFTDEFEQVKRYLASKEVSVTVSGVPDEVQKMFVVVGAM